MRKETYTVGDYVKKTVACANHYPGWKVNEGIIVDLRMSLVRDDDLSPSDRYKFRERYTYQSYYPIFDMVVEYLDVETRSQRLYRTTQFDFNKD